MELSITTFLLILLFIPGYIYIKIRGYILLKRPKTQFETVIQSIIASLIIWVIIAIILAITVPEKLQNLLAVVIEKLENPKSTALAFYIASRITKFGASVLIISLTCFIIGMGIALLRDRKRVTEIIAKICGRDHYERVRFCFYRNAKDHYVHVSMKDNKEYIGQLSVCPDEELDEDIILSDVTVITGDEQTQLPAEWLMFSINDIKAMEILPLNYE